MQDIVRKEVFEASRTVIVKI
ncbi:MAG: hypothetical protein RLZZ458_1812, partial [Planctomycetota bacterium]